MAALIFRGKFFDNCLPQIELIKELEPTIKREGLNWVGDEKAKIIFSKEPDVLVYSKNQSGIDFKASRFLSKLITDQDLLNSVFYLTEKKLSVNFYNFEKAVAFGVINGFQGQPVVEPVFQNQIIETEKIGNIYNYIKYRSDFGNAKPGYQGAGIFEVGRFGRRTSIGIYKDDHQKSEDFQQFSQGKWFVDQFPTDQKNKNFLYNQFEIFKKDDLLYENDELPFVAVKNNPDERGDLAYIKSEIEEMLAVKCQKFIEIFLGGTKGIISDEIFNTSDEKRADARSDVQKRYRQMFGPILITKKSTADFGNNTPEAGITYGQPVAETFERIEKAIKNRMLQKVGAATDVDSKGTVQQTASELTMIQGGQFRASRWKKNDRQRCLTELFTKICKILQKNGTSEFADFERVQVIISQDEVVAENSMLENLRLAQELGLSSQILNFARYHKLSIIDAEEILSKGGLADQQIPPAILKHDFSNGFEPINKETASEDVKNNFKYNKEQNNV